MHRKSVVLVLALALMAVPVGAWAAGGWGITVMGGLGLPMGDFGDEDKLDGQSGPQVGLDICYDLNDMFAVGVDGTWNQNKHGAEGETEDLGGGITLTADKDEFIAWQFGAHGKYKFPMTGPVKVHAKLGLGVYNLKEDYEYTLDDNGTITVFTDEDDEDAGVFEQPGNRFGGKVGVGGVYMVNEMFGVGLEGEYNYASMDKDKFGVDSITYVGVHALLTYHIMPK